jgi:hypothetical protein
VLGGVVSKNICCVRYHDSLPVRKVTYKVLGPSVQDNVVGNIVFWLVIQVNGATSPVTLKLAILFAKKISPNGFLTYHAVQLCIAFAQLNVTVP